MIGCRIRNQATNNYVFNNPQSIYIDEFNPALFTYDLPAILRYDGANTYATVADASGLDMTNAVSIELWYNPVPAQNANATLLGKNSQYMIEGSGTGTDLKWQFFCNVSGSDRGSGLMNTALTPGRLNHLAFTYDSATHVQKIYVNGVLDLTNTLTGLAGYTLGTSANTLYIGTRQGFTGSRPANGQMGEVRIWSGVALNATDVANHYQCMSDLSSGAGAILVSRWKSSEGSGTTLTDSVSAYNGTITGGLWNFPYTTLAQRPILATGAAHTVDDVITALQQIGLVRQT
jgi:hypothetical protein